MNEPKAYLNGQFVPASAAVVPVYDSGFIQGTTIAEQLRTFAGKLFRFDEHYRRLLRSLEMIGVELDLSREQLCEVADRLVKENHSRLADGDDLGLAIFVTPGPYPTLAPVGEMGPTICLHTYPLPFQQWAGKYTQGESLLVSDVRQVPGECWPAELKCRSRMHYYLADRQAASVDPGARALLLDADGFVCEASTANVVAYFKDEGIVSPLSEKILPGISVSVLAELAKGLGIPFSQRNITADQLSLADEIILSSTTCCLLPVVRLNRRSVGNGRPGSVFGQMLEAWGKAVGVDLMQQATRFQTR